MSNIKKNFKLYKQEGSTKIAFVFFVVFLVLFFVTLITPLNYKNGVRNNFKTEKISFMSSNGTDTTYLVSKDNHLFYSLYKNSDISHLNKLTNTKNLANEYVDPTSHLNNFIYIDYEFDSKIIKVDGDSDLRYGYTLILTSVGTLYAIDTNGILEIEKNIKDFSIMFNNILIKNNEGNLLYYTYKNSKFNKESITINSLDLNDFFFSKVTTDLLAFYYTKDNELFYKEIDLNNNLSVLDNKENIDNIKYIASNGSCSIVVTNDNKIIGIDDIENTFSNQKYTYIDNNYGNIEKVYKSGEYSFIFNINKENYYLGKIYNNTKEDYNNLICMNNKYDYIFSGKYSTVALKNKKIYLYNKDTNKFEGMYENFFINYGLRYFSLFVVLMIIIYFLISFKESNKRYNRYFNIK